MGIRFVSPGEGDSGLARVCIVGEQGMGKTRLAGTFPEPLYLDCENGAATARKGGVNRIIVPTDRDVLKNARALIDAVGSSKLVGPATVEFKPKGADAPIRVSTLVLDTLDAVQQPVKATILRGRTKMQRDDWDALGNLVTPLLYDGNALPIHWAIICHVKRMTPEGENKPEFLGLAVQGSLRDKLPGWFSEILHITSGVDGKRYVMTQPIVSKNVRYMAKDRHRRLVKLANSAGIIELPCDEDGYPSSEIANAILWRET
jgi:hypothetical protein